MAPFIYWEFLAACLGMSVRPPALYEQRLTSGPNLATFRLRPAARRHCHISSLHFQTNARRCRVLDSLGGEKARKERPSCPSPSSPLRNSLPIGRELEAAAVPKKVREKISARVASVRPRHSGFREMSLPFGKMPLEGTKSNLGWKPFQRQTG